MVALGHRTPRYTFPLQENFHRCLEALERIVDDADCTDLDECKQVAREALKSLNFGRKTKKCVW
jgi:hypothetical protein